MEEIKVLNIDFFNLNKKEQTSNVNVINDILKLKKYCEVSFPLYINNQNGKFLVLNKNEVLTTEIINRYVKNEAISINNKLSLKEVYVRI